MAKLTAPLLSFSAAGSIAKSIVYSRWKGIKYARQHTIPANPNTNAQQLTRVAFTWVHDAYKYFPADVQAPWIQYAKGQPFTGPNAFSTANIAGLRGATDLSNLIFTKPTGGAPPTQAMTVTPGTGSLTIAATAPTLPSGWTIVKFVAIAMKDIYPSPESDARINYSGSDGTSPYSVTLTGLATVSHIVGGFFFLTKPDGSPAYSGSINGTGTPT